MPIIKRFKDSLIKALLGPESVPRGLFELDEYFRIYKGINFENKETDDGIVAISTDFKYGSIITSGKDEKELDRNIKDAILTSFEVPSSYAKEAKLHKVGEKQKEYVLATRRN